MFKCKLSEFSLFSRNDRIGLVIFFILFSIFFLHRFPNSFGETAFTDTYLRSMEYKISNNLSTSEMGNEIVSIFLGEQKYIQPNEQALLKFKEGRIRETYRTIIISPLYCLMRSLSFRTSLDPVFTWNLFNLLSIIIYFYSSYLLIAILSNKSIAIKSLIVMFSFYGIYTVGKYTGRAYLVLQYAFIIFGCYFLWKSYLQKKKMARRCLAVSLWGWRG